MQDALETPVCTLKPDEVLMYVERYLRKHPGRSIVLGRSALNRIFPPPPPGECKAGFFKAMLRMIGLCRCLAPTQDYLINHWSEARAFRWFNATESDGVVFYKPTT